MDTQPRHGDSRNHHFETENGQRVHVRDLNCVQSVCERYCRGCRTWVETKGILGQFQFMAVHDEHATSPVQAEPGAVPA
jgi:hypothetical protein